MRFAEPYFFWVMSATCLLIAFYLWAFARRKLALRQFADSALLRELLAKTSPASQKLKATLLVMAVLLSLVAVLRPQWGFQWEEVRRKGLDILIALDTSKSMLAEDVLPNRLERSKLAIRDLVKDLQGDRVGLVAFAGTAFLQCPLTLDYNGFLLALESIDVNTIPRGGTSVASAIKEATHSYQGGQQKYKVLVLITDGEDHEGNAVKAAEEAKREGMIIYCIGIGSTEGDLVFVPEEDGRKDYLRDREGNAVKSKLDEELLQKIALATGGTYIRATSAQFGLELLYQERLSRMEKKEFQATMHKRYHERFQLPLALAFLALVAECFISDTRR